MGNFFSFNIFIRITLKCLRQCVLQHNSIPMHVSSVQIGVTIIFYSNKYVPIKATCDIKLKNLAIIGQVILNLWATISHFLKDNDCDQAQ